MMMSGGVVRSLRPFAGVGVTSILLPPVVPKEEADDDGDDDSLYFYVGTKRGKMKKVTITFVRHDYDDVDVQYENCIIQSIENNDSHHDRGSSNKTPYPIFSMMSLFINSSRRGDNRQVVLTGSGDRYITIWEEQEVDKKKQPLKHPHQQEHHDNHNGGGAVSLSSSSWRIKERLGPHTGWVKDLASSHPIPSYYNKNEQEDDRFIFSIGCNCIEVWKTSNRGNQYSHVHKFMIESSVDMGTTLSSDILCLATSLPSCYYYNNNCTDHPYYYLLAGGVDGRIHRWTLSSCSNNSFLDAVEGAVCSRGHDGRVNDLLICHFLGAVVSVGNDGCVNCWFLEDDCGNDDNPTAFMKRRIWSVNVTDCISQEVRNTPNIKLTCSCIFREQQEDYAIIGIGTACGKVLLASITKSLDGHDAAMSISLLQEKTTVQSWSSSSTSTRGCTTIHSLSSQNNHVIIGHSEGISIWDPVI